MKVAPLSSGTMILSILGMVLSYNVFQAYPSWGFAFMLIFVLIFIASLISMYYSPDIDLKDKIK